MQLAMCKPHTCEHQSYKEMTKSNFKTNKMKGVGM